jgi:hypothetical protein
LKAGKSSDDSLKSRNLLPFNFAGLIQPPYIPAPLLPDKQVSNGPKSFDRAGDSDGGLEVRQF